MNILKIKMVKELEQANSVTHGGSFHADDVFSTVFLAHLFDGIKLYRALETSESNERIVYDIGRGKFDHHHELTYRENGIPYAAFGLLWKEFGREYLTKLNCQYIEEIFLEFDQKLVVGIDAVDNGIFPENIRYNLFGISDVIKAMNPNWNEKEDIDECFLKACEFANIVFFNVMKAILNKYEAKEKVEKAIENSFDNILFLEEFMPFMEFVLKSENEISKNLLFAIYPSDRGGFTIRTIEKESEKYEARLYFPSEWSGLEGKSFQEVSGVATARFCHKNLFLATADTLEDAIKLVKIAVKKEK